MDIDVKEIRKGLGLTQEKFAELVGVRQNTISRWEKGIREPKGPALMILRQVHDSASEARAAE